MKVCCKLFVFSETVGDQINLKKILQQYGKVISIRIRCVAPAKITLSKNNQVNPNKNTVNAYVLFKQPEAVKNALELNGTKFEEHTIQVDTLENDRHYDHSMSLFLGNLSFKTNEDELREFFIECGEIKSVRIVRDPKTGMGKGFGYVNFKTKDSVVLAMEKNGQMFKNREIRIKPYKYNEESSSSSSKTKKADKIKNKVTKKQHKSSSDGFQGELAIKKSKKLMKKSMKNRLNASKIKKQKKQIAQIMNKK
ncbi:rna-binding protein 34-like [Dermatophagoides farinae]|uniref:Rna-binding protein 34-like n=1 Tax=Dermatophagoides farinae TaxID=6954 RepID=A0A9D4P7B8_DERFA|nr:rna-binding protein 34-like [Dermatophagoides farinae]